MLIISVFSITLIDNVKSLHAGYIYTEDFEDHADGENAYEAGWFWSTETRPKFACTGTGLFDVYSGGQGNFSFSYEYDLNIKNFSFTFDVSTASADQRIFHFYDSADNNFFRWYHIDG
ncbi:unnamed protein product, partial [marine sediment metagenome]